MSKKMRGTPVSPGLPGRQTTVGVGSVDKLCFKTNGRLNLAYLSKNAKRVMPNIFSGHYVKNAIYEMNTGHTVIVQYGKKSQLQRFDAKLEVNPSKYPSWEAFIEEMSEVTDLAEAEICRLDFCVDLDGHRYPYDEVAKRVFAKGRRTYKLEENGISIGKAPKRAHVYSKDKITRIEVQLSDDYCPVKKFADILQLRDLEPFSEFGLEFKFLRTKFVRDTLKPFLNYGTMKALRKKKQKLSTLKRRQRFVSTVFHLGIRIAYSIYNENENFERDFEKYLKKADGISAKMLDRIWRRSIRRSMPKGPVKRAISPYNSIILSPKRKSKASATITLH